MMGHDAGQGALFSAVGESIQAWSIVEQNIGHLFLALHDRAAENWSDPLRASFEVVISLETRLDMIHATVIADPRTVDYQPHYNALRNKLKRLYKKRHEVAHYTLAGSVPSDPAGGPVILHLLPFFTVASMMTGTGRAPLRVPDIHERTRSFTRAAARVRNHANYIHLTRGRPVKGLQLEGDPLQLLHT